VNLRARARVSPARAYLWRDTEMRLHGSLFGARARARERERRAQGWPPPWRPRDYFIHPGRVLSLKVPFDIVAPSYFSNRYTYPPPRVYLCLSATPAHPSDRFSSLRLVGLLFALNQDERELRGRELSVDVNSNLKINDGTAGDVDDVGKIDRDDAKR